MRSLIVAIALAGAPAMGGTPVAYETDGAPVFRFEVPDNWTLRTGQDTNPKLMPAGTAPMPRIVSMAPEAAGAGAMWVGFWSPPGVSTIEEAEAHVSRTSKTLLESSKEESREDLVIGAGPARVVLGSRRRFRRPGRCPPPAWVAAGAAARARHPEERSTPPTAPAGWNPWHKPIRATAAERRRPAGRPARPPAGIRRQRRAESCRSEACPRDGRGQPPERAGFPGKTGGVRGSRSPLVGWHAARARGHCGGGAATCW